MTLNKVFGDCQNDGLMIVDYLQKSSTGLDSTIIHEFIHSKLFEVTSYGQAVNLIKIISSVDDSYLHTYKTLNRNMREVHEITANTIEYLLYYDKYGEKSFYKELEKLKLDNFEYYKFVNKFDFLFDESRITFENKIRIVFTIGLECLNIDLTNIDPNLLCTNNLLKKHFAHQDNSINYLPNSRFKKIVKELKKYLKNNSDISLDEIENIVYSLKFSKDYNRGIDIISYLKDTTKNSKNYKLITTILDSMKVVSTRIDDLYNLQIASLNSNFKEVKISHEEFSNLNLKIPSVISISLPIDKEILFKLIDCENTPSLNEMLCVYINIQTRTNYIINDLNLCKILNDDENIKVVDLASYELLKYSPLYLLKEKPLYVLSNFTYSTLRESFNYILKNPYKYRTMKFDNFILVIVNIEENINLLILMDNMSFLAFLNDISDGICNYEIISTDENTIYDDLIIKDIEHEYIYNNIICSYLKP